MRTSMALKIINYRRTRTKTGNEILLVWGHGDPRADTVVGLCDPDSKSSNPTVINGQQIFKSTKPPFSRWCLLFRDLDYSGYTVTVIGMKNGGFSTGPESQHINSTAAKRKEPFFTFVFPEEDEDVTAERDDFNPDGDTTTNIVSATIKFPDGSVEDALQIFTDLGLQYWVAQYDSLTESGTYTISITDTVPVTKTLDVIVT
jgi:hypothetical protein